MIISINQSIPLNLREAADHFFVVSGYRVVEVVISYSCLVRLDVDHKLHREINRQITWVER